MVAPSQLEHGDRVEVKYEWDEPGQQWIGEWTGTYLTTENRGHGAAHRIKRDSDGEHIHVHNARDVKITKL